MRIHNLEWERKLKYIIALTDEDIESLKIGDELKSCIYKTNDEILVCKEGIFE